MGKYQLGDWVVDSSRGVLIDGDETIKMEPKCMDLLILLIDAKGDLVSRKAIMESLWQGRYVSDHALNNVVAMLRKYLNKGSDKKYITTQPKRGYILNEPAFALRTTPGEDVSLDERPNSAEESERKAFTSNTVISIFTAVFVIIIAAIIIMMLSNSKGGADSDSNTVALTPNANAFFLSLAEQTDPTQSITNEWQIGMYSGNGFTLFDYSPTTILGRSAVVGWVNRGFHAGFLNTSAEDELFPGNVFKAGALNLHPGDNSTEVVLRYLVQQDGDYDISGHFLGLDSIECLKCTSDGVNVSIRVNSYQLNDSGDITGFGDTTTYQIAGYGISLQQGDVVDFIVMPRSTFFDDATIVTASVALTD